MKDISSVKKKTDIKRIRRVHNEDQVEAATYTDDEEEGNEENVGKDDYELVLDDCDGLKVFNSSG